MTLYILQCYICSQQADNKVYRGAPDLVYAIVRDKNCFTLVVITRQWDQFEIVAVERTRKLQIWWEICVPCCLKMPENHYSIISYNFNLWQCCQWALVFCHRCTICKKKKTKKQLFLSIGFFFHLCGWQPWYLFFCLMEILELLVESEVLLWKTQGFSLPL